MKTKPENIHYRRSLVLDLILFADSGVGEVGFDDIATVTGLSRSEIAHHLNVLAKKERVGINSNGNYFKKDIIIVRANGDAESAFEGGWNYLFDVELCDVSEENGKLEWRRISFPHVPYAFGHLPPPPKEEKVRAPMPTFHETHVRDHGTVGEDILDLLHERGVNIIYLPRRY